MNTKTLTADQINEAGKKWLQLKAQTQGDKMLKQLTEEQLDAVSGGSPSLWDILGPAILAITGPLDLGGYGGKPKPY
jgi:bacteriocin-like protein